MPEGAEVKRCSEVINFSISNKVLHKVEIISGKLMRLGVKNIDKLELPSQIQSIYAHGKLIFIELSGPYSIVSTLGMSGWWYPDLKMVNREELGEAYYSKVINTISKAEKHTRLRLTTEDGSVANYVDPRNFGNFYVLDTEAISHKKSLLGIDFLNDSLEEITLRLKTFLTDKGQASRWGKKLIGELLLDQEWISGLGNIYRAETMYLSQISPHRKLSSLSDGEVMKLLKSAELVLTVAYNGRGVMTYPIGDLAQLLNFNLPKHDIQRHMVYGCNYDIFHNQVISEQVGGRTCWWVPSVQV